MTIEAMKMALEALTRIWEDGLENFPESGHDAAITALRTAIEAAEPATLQVSPTDFVDMVLDKEDAIGKPIFWAEWPNREKNT
jgi:hypothetical protein